jgi:hypothetical protein
MANTVERFGTEEKATIEERMDAARALATKLAEKVSNYTYSLKKSDSKDGSKTYVTIYVNGKKGKPNLPARIGIGDFATPALFVNDDADGTDAVDSFLEAAAEAGIRIRVPTL